LFDGFILAERIGKDECADKKSENLDFTQDSLIIVASAMPVLMDSELLPYPPVASASGLFYHRIAD